MMLYGIRIFLSFRYARAGTLETVIIFMLNEMFKENLFLYTIILVGIRLSEITNKYRK